MSPVLMAAVSLSVLLISARSLTGQYTGARPTSPDLQIPDGQAAVRPSRAPCRLCHMTAYTSGTSRAWQMWCVIQESVWTPSWGISFIRDPIRIFGLDEVVLVYGSRYKQRYFTKRGDDHYPLPAQWDVAKKRWLPYHVEVGTDWPVPFYGPSNYDRPTGPTCDGCPSVNYNILTKQVAEWNVGCEKCQGPGSEHAADSVRANIVDTKTLDFVRGNDVCIKNDSQGQPLDNPING